MHFSAILKLLRKMYKFLGLFPIQEATGENVFNVINKEIISCGQPLENCICYGSDGAANIVKKITQFGVE